MSVSLTLSPLRTILLVDAVTCVVMGAALVSGAAMIAALTALPPALLLYAGFALFPIAAFMIAVAGMSITWRAGVWLIIAGNAAWVVGSLWLLVSGFIAPNALGCAFIAAQAIAVALLATLEHIALRRGSIAVAA
jgi:hypothetical protein